jgi:CRISPR/Cas system-associated exonuclease Cas4 (RecB family)
MLHSPFEYQKIQRIEKDGVRLYETESGPLPSVTTILSKTSPPEKTESLDNWRNRVGIEKAEQITKEASNVGTVVHETIELWVNGQERPKKTNMLYKVGYKMADVIIDNIKSNFQEFWGSEVNLYYPGLYAGTTDLTGIYKNTEAICDFKQSNKPKKDEWITDYKLQLCAYALAHNELFGTNIRNGYIFMCSRDLTFQEFHIGDDEFDYWSVEWAKRVEQFNNG